MFRLYEFHLREKGPNPKDLGSMGFLCMSHWLASLHIVVEGWARLKKAGNPYAHDVEIDKMLSSSMVDSLNDFRNAVYHFHPQYFSKKSKDFFDLNCIPRSVERRVSCIMP
jgi:hypothetical protein